MNPIEGQRAVIDQLYHIVSGSMPAKASAASCWFDYRRSDDGNSSVGQRFTYQLGGETVSAALDRELRRSVMQLVKQLHQLMKEHTGGDWQAFTLSIEENGQVKTQFDYGEEKPSA